MSDILWIDGRFTTTAEPVFTVEDRGLLFGDAVYEVVKFVDGAPVLFAAHWRRLVRSLAMLEIGNPWAIEELASIVDELLARTSFTEGIIYLQVTRGAGTRSHAWGTDTPPRGFVYSSRGRVSDETMRREGVAVITIDDGRWARCDIKSVNLLANVIAKTEARRAGVYEALFVKGDRIVEGASSNVFAFLDGALVTPAEGSELLPGTVRAAVIELARNAGIEVSQAGLRLTDLARAPEVLLTSTSSFVLPVRAIDGRRVGDGARGPVTARLQELLAALERAESESWKKGVRP